MSKKINSQNNFPQSMGKTSKFNPFEKVIISGNHTGLGDMNVIIYEVEFNKIDEGFYYLVSSFTDRFYCNEKFLSPIDTRK